MTEESAKVPTRPWFVARRAALLGVVLLASVRGALLDTGLGNLAEFCIGALIGGLAVGGALLITTLCARFMRQAPAGALVTLVALILALLFLDANPPAAVLRTVLNPNAWTWPLALPNGLQVPSLLVLVLAFALLAALVSGLQNGSFGRFSVWRRATLLAVAGLAIVLSGLIVASLVSDGEDPFPSDYRSLAGVEESPAADPSAEGAFAVQFLSYGAGDNPLRPEFGVNRQLESKTVNAAPLLKDWKGIKQRMRERYWGFGLGEAPLNGLVWAPDGPGPFPLVLIVHGNHGMEDYSDPGYAYLGEVLASRGFLTVSVDENYINGTWSGDFGGKEMPLRAWLLLEHLALWRDWNETPGHRFHQMVDMDNVALVGHSRGGEAVSIAYAYNSLPHYPDDATVRFDYGFAIRSLVAIAQVDQRYHRRVELSDVNFLALQGSYDSDEPAFHGMRQFNRIELGDDAYRFKAGVYIHGANHGQFNSTWGREDAGAPGAWLLNLRPIIPAADQQQIAKVYISAFLETTLRPKKDYLPLFRDPRYGAGWLPDQAYVNRFMDSTFLPIATFEEDLDVTSGTADSSRIAAHGFRLWREEELKHRDERLQGSSAVVLGRAAAETATYEIALPETFWPSWIRGEDLLTLAVSGSTESLPPEEGDEADPDSADAGEPVAPRFRLEMEDQQGRVTSIASEEIAHLAPPLRVRYLKSKRLNKERYLSDWEPVLQVVEVPLFRLLPEGAEVSDLRRLRLRMEGTPGGVMIVDDIGIRRAHPH